MRIQLDSQKVNTLIIKYFSQLTNHVTHDYLLISYSEIAIQ